jgi:uncharacterized protein YndB with AHSA1/START domain
MAKGEASIVIYRPIEEVFARLTDYESYPEWDTGLVQVRQTPEGSARVGTRVTEVRRFLGRTIETRGDVVEYDPPTRCVRRGTAPMPVTGWLTFESTGEGTRVVQRLEMEQRGLFGLADPLVSKALSRGLTQGLAKFKDWLESRENGEPVADDLALRGGQTVR